MVAEAIPEVEQTPPEVVDNPNLEPAPETTPAPEADEEESVIDSILESFGSDEETGADDGKGATTDGSVSTPEKALTPEEAKEQGRREAEAELATRQTAAQRQAYLDGVRRSFQAVDAELDAKADEWGLPTEARQWLRGRFQAHNGHWNVLYQAELEQAAPQLKVQGFNEGVIDASEKAWAGIKEELGEPALKAIQSAKPETWDKLAAAIAKEARKGYVAKEEVTKAQRKVLAKLKEPLAARGITLEQLTGSTGPSLKSPTGGSGPRITTDHENNVAFNEGRITREQFAANQKRFREQENR